MGHTIRLGRITGISIGINWSVAALASVFVATLALVILPVHTPDASTPTRLLAAMAAVIVFFVSILAHELGHAVVAQSHGIRVEKITLWLLGGLAELDRPPPTPKAEFRVAIAGPAVSALVGVFFACITAIAAAASTNQTLLAVLSWLAVVNGALALFNILPAAPLDGGRVLAAILWRHLEDPHRSRLIAGRCGLILGVVIVCAGAVQLAVGDFSGAYSLVVGLFVFTAARSEIVSSFVDGRISKVTVGDVASLHPPLVHDATPITDFLDSVSRDQQHTARPVVGWDYTPVGYAIPVRAASVDSWHRSSTPVLAITTPSSHVVRANADAALRGYIHRWVEAGDIVVEVIDPLSREPMGTVTPAQITYLLSKPKLWGTGFDKQRVAI